MLTEKPLSIELLMLRAQQLRGYSLGALANELKISLPKESLHGKGAAGQLLELVLGATAGSLAQPDFQELGVELKTIPIDNDGRVMESTYISKVPLHSLTDLTFENSELWGKLKKVLWIPIITEKGLPLTERVIGDAVLWQPSMQETLIIRKDWQELMDMVAMGEIDKITAKIGQVMQIRPKGANGKALTRAVGPEGYSIMTLPRGFYLRSSFTQHILDTALSLL